MGVGSGVAVAVGMMKGAADAAAGVTPIGGTGLGGPTGVAGSGPGPGDPQADNTAKTSTTNPAINSRREGFITILLKTGKHHSPEQA
jgi:hypothetical protein